MEKNRAQKIHLFLESILIVLFLPAFVEAGQVGDTCLNCHGDRSIVANAGSEQVSLYVSKEELDSSVHFDARCTSCHSDVGALPHERSPGKVNCGICHEEEEKSYDASVHGMAAKGGDRDVPGCAGCHGDHHILPVKNPESKSFSLNIVNICLSCHEDEEMDIRHNIPGARYIKAYRNSVHGKAITRAGLNVSAVCPDCHGNHKILPADMPSSKVNKLQIPGSCGKCHPGIENEYEKSVHAKGLRAGIIESPVCTDCHGEHRITEITDPASKVYSKNIPETCGKCHESEAISSRYALPKRRLSTYRDSFHGIALEYGMTKAANCASCHGYHLILPSSDPKSMVNRESIPKTCGTCHPGTSENFARGKVHVEVSKEGHRGVWFVRIFYTGFIGLLLILFVSHISFDIIERRRHRVKEEKK